MKLDDDFAQAAHIPDGDLYPPRWAAEAEAFRSAHAKHAELAVPYGPSPRQAYDLFRAATEGEGTMVFVHGGYWLRNDRSSWSQLAKGAVARGWDVAVVEYDLCPRVRISDITDQIAQAIAHLARRTVGPISLTGHSAGGQLVARMLEPGMLSADILARINAVVPIAPVADLCPLLQTSMKDDLRLDIDSAKAESPVLQPAPDTPVQIWVGENERPALLAQAEALARAWDVQAVIVPGQHHFDIIDALLDPQSEMVRFLTEQ